MEVRHILADGPQDKPERKQAVSDIFGSTPEQRKTAPIYTGLLSYFPLACAAVARHSVASNEQHNPGEPVHWAQDKSIGTGDQIVRHLTEGHLEACAWRALELLERKLRALPPFATDTPANSEAVERESAEGVRCFEWVDSVRNIPILNALVQFREGRFCDGIRYDGSEAEGESLTNCSVRSSWREFPAAEWDAKVAAVKSAALAAQTPVAPEWPKWTLEADDKTVRVYASKYSGRMFYIRSWRGTVMDVEDHGSITRAEAVRLIGEDAVREGERLVGVRV
jgi:hypothetical protein